MENKVFNIYIVIIFISCFILIKKIGYGVLINVIEIRLEECLSLLTHVI